MLNGILVGREVKECVKWDPRWPRGKIKRPGKGDPRWPRGKKKRPERNARWSRIKKKRYKKKKKNSHLFLY